MIEIPSNPAALTTTWLTAARRQWGKAGAITVVSFTLTPAQLQATFDVGPGSVHKTVMHRWELQHMLQRLGVEDIIEGDALGWEWRLHNHTL